MAYKIVAKKLNSLTPYEIDDDRKKQIVSELFLQVEDRWETEPAEKDIELFTLKELEAAAANIKCGKAPGPDQIPPEAVKIMAECLPNWILAVMNNLLEKQEFPNKWKEARVVLIPKSGKLQSSVNSSRPLCMLNVLSKLLEILIKNRLQEELGGKGGLHPNQYSYQKGKSTIQAIEGVIETVRDYKCKWTQRKMLLRVASAYKTVSAVALQIITGTIPIDVLVKERAYAHYHRQEETREVKERARDNSLIAWQQRWESETVKAQWTKRLIPIITQWINDECMYCGEEDTAEHTIFKCSRWRENRDSAYHELGRELTPETLVMTMITSDTAWKTTFNMIKTIMSAKEKEEMARQERERREN
ncbi:hypothetical protein NQ317_009522 [Molorchus minor]|uniref:Reverse transcriptase domain-containing protein n=1 Tax=Molorchus minor TaxID=1323400 RepID=A0ABQ9J0L0_9CUCU|nr:hypothetical protein NQ317_009522 [Molorchus minor]